MTFKELKNKIKEEQKVLAKEIRELKSKRKSVPYGYVRGLDRKRFDYRHRHIAYCQFFNKTSYELIEQSCYIPPIESIVEAWIKEWTNRIFVLEQEDFELVA